VRCFIFYGDGTMFEGPPEKADTTNVQAIVQKGKKNWHTVSHADFYCLDKEMGFYGVDEAGYYQYMFEPGYKLVMFGRTIDTEKFQKIFQTALSWADKLRRAEQ